MDAADGRPYNVNASQNMFCEDIKSKMQSLVYKMQEHICQKIQTLEECETFSMNKWNRSEGIEGITQILEDGDIFEKVGINASNVTGILPSTVYNLLKKQDGSSVAPTNITYFSTGINGVLYPKNPHIPVLNFNYRYFEMNDGKDNTWWFGGSSDLIPSIINKSDCQHFHRLLKQCCDKYAGYYYEAFKKNCDEHFYLAHRGERRGIGGIFFNELCAPDHNTCFEFVAACMQNIIPSYMPIVIKNMEKGYFSRDKEWQLVQRGRCVEFNLICDKTTKILLMMPGVEIQSTLIVLPPLAKWCYHTKLDTNQKELTNILRNPIEWI